MKLTYSSFNKLLNLSDYTSSLSSAAQAECTTIYTTVSAIDFVYYVDECNRLSSTPYPTSATVADFDALINDIDTDLTVVKGLISGAKDKRAATPAIVVRGELSTLRSQVKSERDTVYKKTKHPTLSKITGTIDNGKKVISKVDSVYKKATGPAESLFNKVESGIEDGGSDFYSSFLRRKK